MTRIALFLATNLAILIVLSVTTRPLDVEPDLDAQGLDLGTLLLFAAAMALGGSLSRRHCPRGRPRIPWACA